MSLQHYAIEITYLLIFEAYQIISINVKLYIYLVLSAEVIEVYFTRNVMVGFVNLTEETGEAVAARIYGGMA